MRYRNLRDLHEGGWSIWGGGRPPELSCLDDVVQKAAQLAYDEVVAWGRWNPPPPIESLGDIYSDPVANNCLSSDCSDFREAVMQFIDNHVVAVLKDQIGSAGTSTWYMDKNCQKIERHGEECDRLDIQYMASPISLIWNFGAKEPEQIALTQFQLSPGMQGKWYSWRASAKMPLLVYDPEHKGRVTSATQLFGNWTFGGKKVASLSGAPSTTSWQNGYEALSTLDANGDGELSGDELLPLSLWFDKNQDGKSQKGEVVPTIDVGIRRIFYTPDRTDEISGDIYASRGYERAIDNKVITGSSVDWYSQMADSQFELLAREKLRFSQTANHKILLPSQQKPQTESALSKSIVGPFSGVWLWKGDKATDENQTPHGLLVLREHNDNKLSGFSLIELPIETNRSTVDRMVTTVSLKGKKLKSNDGNQQASFEIMESNKMETTSEISLNKDGTRMSGSSTTIIRNNRGEPPKIINYTWKARRYLPPLVK